jgi:hypothetical protein
MPFDRSMELLFLRQLFTPNYTQLAMLAGLLLAIIYRPERIRFPRMLRVSCLLLAVSIIVNPVATAAFNAVAPTANYAMGSPRASSDLVMLYQTIQIVEPILVALSIVFGLFSLIPSSRRQSRSAPEQHPLDS